jgi:16S rRNA (adenine1518-N6/adenine1519-N6)-dimethyltransferase
MQDLDTRLRQFLQSNNIRLNTDIGQHFLRDEEVLEAIMEAANVEPRDHVVEIGPGVGILTELLLQKAKHVTAVELDVRMTTLMKWFIKGDLDRLSIIHGNALQTPMPTEPYKIVANIPYHITSPLIRHVFMESPVHPSSMTLLIQKEVAEKICDEEHAGLLTIIVGLYGKARMILEVPPACFMPPPEVDSAVIHIECFKQPLAEPEVIDRVTRLLKLAFGGKRKMLRNTLGSLPDGDKLMKACKIEGTRRPETLTVQEWIALAKSWSGNREHNGSVEEEN